MPSPDAPDKASRASRLAARAPRALSAQEALKRAIEAERAAEAEPEAPDPAIEEAEREKKREAARQIAAAALARAEAAKAKATRPRKAPSRPAPAAISPGELLVKRLPAFQVERIVTLDRREAFKAVWTAHRTRAGVLQDPALVATADALIDASMRLPPRTLHAALVRSGTDEWAIFLDTASGTLLAALQPAARWLDGLSG